MRQMRNKRKLLRDLEYAVQLNSVENVEKNAPEQIGWTLSGVVCLCHRCLRDKELT